MKTRIVQLTMASLIVLSSLVIASMLVPFLPQLTGSDGINTVYAGPPPPAPPPNPGPPPNPIPDPSTLILLGTGLAAGGGIYAIRRYLNRNKKK